MGLTNNLGKLSSIITSTGSAVGIGTTSPARLLTVYNASADPFISLYGGATNEGGILFGNTSGGDALGQIRYLNGSNFMYFVTNGSERMRITSTGNVGIGTTSDNYRLEVNANAATWATRIYNASATGSGLVVVTQNTTTSAGLALYNGSSYVLYARNDGNVGIGTSSPANTLDVAGSFKVSGSAFFAGSVYNYVGGARFFAQGGGINYLYSGSSSLNLVNQADTGTIGTFNGTTGVYTASSDINKKKDFEASTIGLNEILQLKPTLYRFKTEEETAPKQLGFIAQEVQTIIPQAYEESGEGDKKFIGLNFNPIVAALVKAIQELSAQNQDLKSRLDKAGL